MPIKKTQSPAKAPTKPAATDRSTAGSAKKPPKPPPDRRDKTTPTEPAAPLSGPGFFVVGIGASAGGLEAMSEMLNHLPPDIGMAFVLVQHLAPGHDSMMSELLTRETTLAVSEITDGMKIAANHLYVIPPNTNLGIINGVLHLMPRGLDAKQRHLPIDYFFQSLAKDQGHNAIGIILSGSASDGTEGLKAIRTEGGITFAQDSDTARYDSMPNNAIATGCVDFVLNPQGIAQELTQIARHPEVLRADIMAGKEDSARMRSEMEKILILYTGDHCHLCDQAKALLDHLLQDSQFKSWQIKVINITSDRQLQQQYGLRIPVVTGQGFRSKTGKRRESVALVI